MNQKIKTNNKKQNQNQKQKQKQKKIKFCVYKLYMIMLCFIAP